MKWNWYQLPEICGCSGGIAIKPRYYDYDYDYENENERRAAGVNAACCLGF